MAHGEVRQVFYTNKTIVRHIGLLSQTWAQRVIPDVAFLIPIFVAMSTFGSANGSMFAGGR